MVRVQTPKTPAPIQMLQWVLNPTEYANTNFQRFGDCYQAAVLPMNPEPLIFLNHPEAIQYLLTKDSSDVLTAPGEANALAEPLLGKNSVILASGKQHRRQRQLLMPPFHGERMKAYGTLICQITQELIDEWPIGEARCTRQLMQTITMRVILQAIFGLYESDRYRRLEKLLGERLDLVSTPLTSMIIFLPQLNVDLGPWSLGGKIRQVAAEIDELIYAEIQERRANFDPDRTDVLSLLLSARDEQGAGLTDEELHDELMTLLVAGHETTATALTWALYWIHQLPEVQRKLIAELEPWKDSSDLTAIARLPYLKAVCNETLRIYPVALLTLPRRVEQPITLMGRDLETGSLLMGCIYSVHHRPELYPEPEQFRPERFLERQFSPYEFVAFGGGARRCIGAALAMYEMPLILHTILNGCELKRTDNRTIKPKRRGATLAPGRSIQFKKISHSPGHRTSTERKEHQISVEVQ